MGSTQSTRRTKHGRDRQVVLLIPIEATPTVAGANRVRKRQICQGDGGTPRAREDVTVAGFVLVAQAHKAPESRLVGGHRRACEWNFVPRPFRRGLKVVSELYRCWF